MISGGLGLNLLVSAPYTMAGDWMAFSLCYSIIKYLPDAKIYLQRITNKQQITRQYFSWGIKLGISEYKKIVNPFILKCHSLIVRPVEINEPLICSEVGEDKFTPFVSYVHGCGGFVYDEWINKDECPFAHAENFMTYDIGMNEVAVLKLWRQMNNSYQFLTGG